MFYNSSNNFEYNDCVSRGACSVSPTISSMQEVMLILLRQIAYYLVKLKELGVKKEIIERDIISQIALIDAAKDLAEVQILDAFSNQYNNLVQARKEYLKLCREKDVQCKDLKNLIKLSPKTNLSAILKRGDREFLQKYKNRNSKYLTDILSAVLKSVCVNLVNLYDLDETCSEASDTIISSLNLFNMNRVAPEKLIEYIINLAKCDVEILSLISRYEVQNYGEIEETEVSYATRPNKAIMVSGSNLADLKSVLETVKDKDIDVYTNGNLLIAHAFPYFKNSENLKGHFGAGVFNTILDFATFPGAILLTKNESQNIEYLYRGRLFTTDDISPQGIVKIENNDFSPLIESALQAKGFAKGQNRGSVKVGFDETKLKSDLDKISNAEKIFIIGPSNLSLRQKDYFEKFFDIMPENTAAISFSYNPDMENVIALNLGNDYAILYKVLKIIFEKIPVVSDKLAFFFTKCDVNSLSNIINLHNKGAKNLFISDCPPLVINPAVLRSFTELFNVNHMTNPKNDLAVLDI